MNILQVIPELDAGGAERTTLEVSEAIIAKGGKAYVASQGGRLEDELAAMGGRLIRLDMKTKNPFRIWRHAARLCQSISAFDIDLIHARSRAPAWSAMWAAKRMNIPFVTTYHGAYNAKTGIKRWYNSVMARGDIVIANSNYIEHHIHHEYPGMVDRIAVIHRGVDLDRFQLERVDEDKRSRLLSDWDLPPGRPVLLLPARLTRWKGQILAIEALGLLMDLDPQPVLVLAGDAQGRNAYVDEIKNKAAALNVDMRMPGHVRDMVTALAASDLVLTPSIEPEAFGRTAAEAQAMGKPVIAADHGGAVEVVVDGQTGWRVPPGNTARLAELIRQALQLDPQERVKMATLARKHIESHFSTASLQQKTLQVYEQLLK